MPIGTNEATHGYIFSFLWELGWYPCNTLLVPMGGFQNSLLILYLMKKYAFNSSMHQTSASMFKNLLIFPPPCWWSHQPPFMLQSRWLHHNKLHPERMEPEECATSSVGIHTIPNACNHLQCHITSQTLRVV